MIWHYFPIGMRFPVNDFSDASRRDCWRIALSAIYASDPKGTFLYEACETFDPLSQSPVYTCIICYYGIVQSREAGKTMHSLDGLMTRLCLCNPLVQANYLEGFGPYPVLAEINSDGTLIANENGAAFLPVGQIEPMRPSDGWKLLLAPDSMKGVCSAERLTRALGIAAVDRGFRVRRMPVADGGEGTVCALVAGTDGRCETISCSDLNGTRVSMSVGIIPGPTAVIEVADAIGFSRKNEQTPPIERRTSFGVGQMILKTMDLGYRKIWIGLGGSLTADLGLGALAALGMRFYDTNSESVAPCPETLSEIVRIDREELDPRLTQTEITLLYDVSAPLLGENGALRVFGPQKGATEKQIAQWETEFERLSAMLGGDPAVKGSGAAGGLGFGLASIGGILTSGADKILDRVGLSFAMRDADFVITGEGSFDAQSIRFRKAPVAVMEMLLSNDRPGCLFVGKTGAVPDDLLRGYPKLRGIITCPIGDEPYEETIMRAFDRDVLPMIGKDVANSSD
ncbi:MAG: glycerate kinase [Clostridia bacterium]|nr:glycerate kinase [Clostridia bacterium]